jgi:hypothetical protein
MFGTRGSERGSFRVDNAKLDDYTRGMSNFLPSKAQCCQERTFFFPCVRDSTDGAYQEQVPLVEPLR